MKKTKKAYSYRALERRLERMGKKEVIQIAVGYKVEINQLRNQVNELMQENEKVDGTNINRIMELNDEKLKLEEYVDRLKDSINLQDKNYNELLEKAKQYKNAFKLLVKEINDNGK